MISDCPYGRTVSTMKIFTWQPICTSTTKSSDTTQVPNGQCADENVQSLSSLTPPTALPVELRSNGRP